MPIVDPTNPLAGSEADFTQGSWREYVSNRSLSSYTGTAHDGEAILVGHIPGWKLLGAMRYCLGWQYATGDTVTGFLLRRDPVRHPYLSNWRCVQADAVPFAPQKVPTVLAPDTPLRTQVTSPDDIDLGGYANYDRITLTLRFKPPVYSLGTNPDSATGSVAEWNRYVERNIPRAQVQTIGVPHGRMVIVEGPLANDVSAAAEIVTQFCTADIQFTWHRVPERWVIGTNGVPRWLLAGLGKANLTEWNSYPKATLFCDSITLGKYPWPWKVPGTGEDDFLYDVQFSFLHRDPYNGFAASTARGWELVPAPAATAQSTSSRHPWYKALWQANDGTVLPNAHGPVELFEFANFFKAAFQA